MEKIGRIGGGNLKKLSVKATKRIDANADGDVDTYDMKSQDTGEYYPGNDGKKKKVKFKFEKYQVVKSDWKEDLIEVIDKIEKKKEGDGKVIEKKINNKIVINPPMGMSEAIEEIGGKLIEIVEGGNGKKCPKCGCYYEGKTHVCKPKDEIGEEVQDQKLQQIQKKQLQLDRKKIQLRMQSMNKKKASSGGQYIASEENEMNKEKKFMTSFKSGMEKKGVKFIDTSKKPDYKKTVKRVLNKRGDANHPDKEARARGYGLGKYQGD